MLEISAVNPALIPISVFALVIVVLIWATAVTGKRAAENMRQLADKLGLQAAISPPTWGIFYPTARAGGILRDKVVEVFPFSTGSGKSRVQWCAISAAARRHGGLTFVFRKQGFGTKVMEMFGAHEIEVGDPAFDREWFIQTNQPDFMRAALVPELRTRLTGLARGTGARGPQLQLEGGIVRYAEQGTFSDPLRCGRIVSAAPLVCDFADLAEVFGEQA